MWGRVFAAATVLLIVCVTVNAALTEVTESPETDKEIIKKLIDRVERLEGRIEVLEKTRVIAIPSYPTHTAKPIPKQWGVKEFNGMPYYIVPLDSGKDSSSPLRLPSTKNKDE